jgi:hypothetical protein
MVSLRLCGAVDARTRKDSQGLEISYAQASHRFLHIFRIITNFAKEKFTDAIIEGTCETLSKTFYLLRGL